MPKSSTLLTPFKDATCEAPKASHSDWGGFGDPLTQAQKEPTEDFIGKGGTQYLENLHGVPGGDFKPLEIAGIGSTPTAIGKGMTQGGGKKYKGTFEK